VNQICVPIRLPFHVVFPIIYLTDLPNFYPPAPHSSSPHAHALFLPFCIQWNVWSVQRELRKPVHGMKEKFISERQDFLIIREYWNPWFNLNMVRSMSLPAFITGKSVPDNVSFYLKILCWGKNAWWATLAEVKRFWYVLIKMDITKNVWNMWK